jgi:hypothetical protein
MRIAPIIGAVVVVAGVIFGKVLRDHEVRVAREKAAEENQVAKGDQPPPPPPPHDSPPTPRPTPPPPRPVKKDPERSPELTGAEESSLDETRGLIARGQFAEASDLARSVRGSEDLNLAAHRLDEKAQLLAALTKAVRPHPFAGATDLVAVTLASGISHTARVLRESDSSVVLALADGRELDVRPERIAKREKISADAWSRDARAGIEKKVAELPKDAGALEIYHLACEGFEVGARTLGVTLLERALGLEGGAAIIDVYGAGDLDLLRRAQQRIRKSALASNPELLAEVRRPRTPRKANAPPPSPEPGAPSPPDVPPISEPPPPEPPPASPGGEMDFERLEGDALWKGAHEAYQRGIELYRSGFAGRSAGEKQDLKDGRARLEKARELLDQLPSDMTSDAAQSWDSFSARVNEILRAVKKQQAATGS